MERFEQLLTSLQRVSERLRTAAGSIEPPEDNRALKQSIDALRRLWPFPSFKPDVVEGIRRQAARNRLDQLRQPIVRVLARFPQEDAPTSSNGFLLAADRLLMRSDLLRILAEVDLLACELAHQQVRPASAFLPARPGRTAPSSCGYASPLRRARQRVRSATLS